jgi:hypothetical protein
MSQVFAPPLWIRLLVVGCAAVMGLFDLALVAAALLGGWEPGMEVAAAVLGLMSVLSVVVVVQNLRRAVLHEDHVELGLPLISRRVGLHEIQRVEHAGAVLLHTPRGVFRCKLAMRDPQARFVAALQKALPEGRSPIVPGLPWTWRPRRGVVLTNLAMVLAFGPGAVAMGLGIGFVAVQQGLAGQWLELVVAVAMVLVMFALGALMTSMFLWSFRWRVDFGEDELLEVFPVRRRRHSIADLEDIRVDGETRTYKGRSRQAWWLALRFAGEAEEVRMELTENGVATAHNAEADKLELDQLCGELRALYGLDAPHGGALEALLARAQAMEPGELAMAFETLRDELAALREPGALLDAVLAMEAEEPVPSELRELLVTVLADFGHGPAMVHMVRWLDVPEDQLRFVAAMALDGLAGGRFGVEGCIEGGWVQHDRIQALVPALKAWWADEGAPAAAARARHQERAGPPPVISEHHKRCNFLEKNPEWAMLGDGEVRPPTPGGPLPRGRGVHLVGGQIHEAGGQRAVFAVFEMDPESGGATAAWVRGKEGWLERRRGRDRWEPRWGF